VIWWLVTYLVEKLVAWILRVEMNSIGVWADYVGDFEGLGHRARTDKSK
jgi:hypothetical protein